MKKLISFILAITLLTAAMPTALASGAEAARKISIRFDGYDHGSNLRVEINVSFVTVNKSEAVTEVYAAAVPAGTNPALITDAQKFPLRLRVWWGNYIGDFPNDMLFQDINIYLFINDHPPVTDGCRYRLYFTRHDWYDEANIYAYKGSRVFRNEKSGLPGPNEDYPFVLLKEFNTANNSFDYALFSFVDAKTELRLSDHNGSTIKTVQINQVGMGTYIIPDGNYTGQYTLSLTKDGGANWLDVCWISVFQGKMLIVPYMIYPFSDGMSYREGWLATGDRYTDIKGLLGKDGVVKIKAEVMYEDFLHPVTLTVTDLESGTNRATYSSFDGTGSFNSWVEPDFRSAYNGNGYIRYTFTADLKALSLPNGTYRVSVIRGNERRDYFKLEVFNGRLFCQYVDELVLRPVENQIESLQNKYICMWLLEETIFLDGFSSGHFSLNGGEKWEPMSAFSKKTLSKRLDKGFTLWLSNGTPGRDSTKYIKFPEIAPREKAPKLAVDYQLAHMVNGVLDWQVGDDNHWVAVERGDTVPLGSEYSFMFEGDKPNGKPSGKADLKYGTYRMNAAGFEIPDCDESEGSGENGARHKAFREMYFVYKSARIQDGVYYPATKPAKLKVSCAWKPPGIKVNYKTETAKIKPNIIVDDAEGLTSLGKDLYSVTAIIEREDRLLFYSVPPTAKKPASGWVEVWIAGRNTGEPISDKSGSSLSKGKFKADKMLEFRIVGAQKWGKFPKISTGDEQIEYRYKATAKNNKLWYHSGWWVIDNEFLWKSGDVWVGSAVGTPQLFEYTWGDLPNGKKGITAILSGIDLN
ncbi:MAG: hypothetical protein LBI19_05470 [Oscillospiraceae bacterium]|jgi:hypothetical protein|nr:hypothetical protein [Oscillospiraceae bacterium]